MPGGLGPRFLIEAGFLIVVAVIAGIERLGAVTIILVMAGAWLLMAGVEWVISRTRAKPAPEPMAVPAEPLEQRREAPAVRTVAPASAVAPEAAPNPSQAVAAASAERRDPEPEPAREPEPATTPGPSPEPARQPDREAPAEPVPEQAPPAQPRVAVVAAVPEPERRPEAVPPQPARQPEPETRVIAFTARSLGVPQQWNLWELERVARERGGTDAIRDEERAFLLMYLREFADADGVLPTSFDGVVREAFSDVLDAVGA